MGEKCRLLKCRNMWGSNDWESDWNVKSPKWTQSLKAQLGVTDEADGIFYVSLNEYATHFKNTVICFQQPATVGRKYFESTESHNFSEATSTGPIKTDDPNFFELSTQGHLTFFKVDLLERIDLSSGVFSISGN